MALGEAYQDDTTDLRECAVTLGEQKSQRPENKSEVGSKESESFKKYGMGRTEIWKQFERIGKRPRKLGRAHWQN